MSDGLEKFIRKNREKFDDKNPGEHNWSKIESVLPGRRVSLWNSVVIWRVAAVLFMGLSVYLMLPRFSASTDVQNEAVLREFHDVESYYVEQIAQKERLIDGLNGPEGLNGFTQDFRQLEAMYSVLREQMKSDPSKEVKDALILNLLVRIDLLNQQLHKLEQEESGDEESETDSKSASI